LANYRRSFSKPRHWSEQVNNVGATLHASKDNADWAIHEAIHSRWVVADDMDGFRRRELPEERSLQDSAPKAGRHLAEPAVVAGEVLGCFLVHRKLPVIVQWRTILGSSAAWSSQKGRSTHQFSKEAKEKKWHHHWQEGSGENPSDDLHAVASFYLQNRSTMFKHEHLDFQISVSLSRMSPYPPRRTSAEPDVTTG
jgi:hypothetical protein